MVKKLMIICLLLSSCDPGRVLFIRAGNHAGVSIIIYGNRIVFPMENGKYIHDSEKTVIRIPDPGRPSTHDTICFYGLGVWDSGHIQFLVDNIDSIIINNRNNQILLKAKPEIRNYFLHHRRGFAGCRLTIKAK
jgi:hypothetical protein